MLQDARYAYFPALRLRPARSMDDQICVRSPVLTQVVRITVIDGVVGAGLAFGLGGLAKRCSSAFSAAAVVAGAMLLVGTVAAAVAAVPARRARPA